MKESIATGLGDFSSHRMVSQYDKEFYSPAAKNYEKLTANDAEYARFLVSQKKELVANVYNGRLRIDPPVVAGGALGNAHVGDKLDITVTVNLGDLPPEAVDVEAYLGTVDARNEIVSSQSVTMKKLEDRGNGDYLYGCQVVCSRSGRFGITARIKAAGTEWDNSVPGFMCWPK